MNNWWSQFQTSYDLKAALRNQLQREAHRANAEGMILRGEAPLILVTGISAVGSNESRPSKSVLFTVHLTNVGPMPAFDMTLRVNFQGVLTTDRVGRIPVVMPAKATGAEGVQTIQFEIASPEAEKLLAAEKSFRHGFWYRCHIEYSTPIGFIFCDMVQGNLSANNDHVFPRGLPEFAGRYYVGQLPLIRSG